MFLKLAIIRRPSRGIRGSTSDTHVSTQLAVCALLLALHFDGQRNMSEGEHQAHQLPLPLVVVRQWLRIKIGKGRLDQWLRGGVEGFRLCEGCAVAQMRARRRRFTRPARSA